VLSRKTPGVQIGSRFVKVGDTYGRVWVVIRLWTTIDGLPHVRLENNSQHHETRIIAVSALLDDHFYIPAPP